MTESPFALELANVSKSFGSVRALDGARLGARAGEIHALLGENGAGKSTLVAIAAGLLRSDAGEIRRDGKAVRFADPREARRAGVALVPQHDLLVEAASVADNLALLAPAAPFLESARARRARVERLAKAFDLDLGRPDARVEELPVGTRQRISIAGRSSPSRTSSSSTSRRPCSRPTRRPRSSGRSAGGPTRAVPSS